MRSRLPFQHLAALCTAALDCIYPRWCAVCGHVVGKGGHGICWNCRTGFKLIGAPYCARCGDPVDGMVEQEFECAWCHGGPVAFARARSAVRYEGGLRAAVWSLKYDRNMSVAADLVALLEACLRVHFAKVAFDAITFVPLHASKERTRTFNQSRILARQLGRRLDDLPVVTALKRTTRTVTQTNLTARQRRENVRGAFEVVAPEWIRSRTFLLMDDVMTTGATAHECAAVLQRAGAAAVYVLTVARG